jgi:hypothetical protein
MAGAAAVGDTQKNPPKKKKIAFAGEDGDEHFSETLGAKQAEEAMEIGSSSTSSIGSDVDMDCDEKGPGSDESDDESSGDQSGVPPSGGSQTGGPRA